jgi:carbamoyl-phosphate synthase large subunit
MKNKNVFISGGSGVIGQELVKLLDEMGANVFVGDLKPRPKQFGQNIKYRQGDLNYITEDEIFSFEPEYFFHLAATFERSTETYDFWYENHRHNSQLGTHLMTIFKDCPTLKKMVNCSSYLIYNPELYYFDSPAEAAKNLVEEDPIYPRNLTGVAKLYHEIELRFLNEFNQTTFKSVSARIYRSYGKNSRDIISRWIRLLLNNEPITVYQKEGLFDYIYAGDVAKGLVKLAVNECEGIYNLGTGTARRVSEIVDVLKEHFPEMKIIERDVDDTYEGSQANMTKFKTVVREWNPMRLEESIPQMIRHEHETEFENDSEIRNNILITSISDKIPLLKAVRKAGAKIGNTIVYGGDINAQCIGAYFLRDSFWLMPRISNLTKEIIIQYCKTHHINIIIPTRDGELLFWAKLKNDLINEGITVLVSDTAAVELCLDKRLFYESPTTDSFPIIPTFSNVESVISEFYVVKERFGAGADSIGIKLSQKEALAHATKLENPIFQPYIAGKEVSVDMYISNTNQVKGVVCRTRDIVVDGESKITSSFLDEKLSELCRSFAETLGLYGHIVLQAFKDSEGNYHIIECNSRFGGASTFSIAAGLDSFYWGILEAQGVNIEMYDFFLRENLRQVRYKSDNIELW